MSLTHMRVIVCGSSVAGMSAAISFMRAGSQVKLYERSNMLDNLERGAGLGAEPPRMGALLMNDDEKAALAALKASDANGKMALDFTATPAFLQLVARKWNTDHVPFATAIAATYGVMLSSLYAAYVGILRLSQSGYYKSTNQEEGAPTDFQSGFYPAHALLKYDENDNEVTVHFKRYADSTEFSVNADLLVCADGHNSKARGAVYEKRNATAVEPKSAANVYSGYTAVRALIPEADLPDHVWRQYFSTPTSAASLKECKPENSQLPDPSNYFIVPSDPEYPLYNHMYHGQNTLLLSYGVPGTNADTRVGHRKLNILWYYTTFDDASIKALMTDDKGTHHESIIAKGQVAATECKKMHAYADERFLVQEVKDLIHAIPDSEWFLHKLSDFCPEYFTAGRVVLIGDAAHVTRPHTASGTRMAMDDGAELVQVLEKAFTSTERKEALAKGLAAFEEQRLPPCQDIVNEGRRKGDNYMHIWEARRHWVPC